MSKGVAGNISPQRQLQREGAAAADAVAGREDGAAMQFDQPLHERQRDSFLGVRRFEDFQQRLGISRPVLGDRLSKLVDAGVLTKVAYQDAPARHEYKLIAKGKDLHPVLMAIVHWGDEHMAGRAGRPLLHRHVGCGHHFDPVTLRSECKAPVLARDVMVERGRGA